MDLIVQPTKKWIRFQYTLVFILFCVAVGFWVNKFSDQPAWLLIVPALLFLWPMAGHLRQHFTRITISGDKLHYESGMLSKTMRTIQITKVQDVRVNQSLGQRLMGIGNLSIETAGETSRLTIENIDQPRLVADQITDAAQGQPQKRKEQQA